MTLDEVKAKLAELNDAVNSLEVAPAIGVVTEVDVVEDGATKKFVPEA